MAYYLKTIFLSGVIALFLSCNTENENFIESSQNSSYETENVILVVVDGPRLIDTWADESKIPFQRSLAAQGVFFNNFYNDGETFTLSGHTAITTGTYETVKNDGSEWPFNPSIFQLYLYETSSEPHNSWIITGKEKLYALGNSRDLNWRGSYLPSVDAQDRPDSLTLLAAIMHLEQDLPSLSLVHFRGPDKYGHAKDWQGYVKSIENTDRYINELWDFIQSSDKYRDKTTLLVTNDHGRHLDEIGTGFKGHGDRCEGCKHISLLALGPDFSSGEIIEGHYGLIDIAPSIAKLLNFNWQGEGQPINELLSD